MKPIAKTIKMTFSACPYQWEGRTIDWRHIYVRYRWGILGVCVDDNYIYVVKHGDEFDAEMTTSKMMELTGEYIDWSEAEIG